MRERTIRGIVAGVMLVCALAGCESKFVARTVLHSDGSVDREIHQPVADSPPIGVKQGWSEPTIRKDNSPGAGNHKYLTADGHFASPEKIPDHVHLKVPGAPETQPAGAVPLPEGTLRRKYTRRDYVFVTEHEWVETLTDSVTMDDMRRARDELADLVIEIGQGLIEEVYGKEYDASELFKWARTEGKAWVAELTDAAFADLVQVKQLGGPDGQPDEPWPGPYAKPIDHLAAICSRHGLKIDKDAKAVGDRFGFQVAFDDYCVGLFCRTVRRRDTGRYVDRATALALMKMDIPNRDEIADRVIARKYGDRAAFDERLGSLLVRVAGVYWEIGVHFEYALAVPGDIAWTNGNILEDKGRVRWTFDTIEAWPAGYPMICRSLEPQTRAQQDLLHGQPLTKREAMADFVSLVGSANGEELTAALRACQERGNMTPLYAYRDALRQGRYTGVAVARVERVLKLLDLPRDQASK
jgi:hypothetical protein